MRESQNFETEVDRLPISTMYNGMLPEAVIFDWDNTLVDTWPCIIHTMNTTLKAMGQDTWSLEEAKVRIAQSLRDSFPKMFGDQWTKARDFFYAELEACHLDMLRVLPNTLETLQFFEDKQIPIAVVSNKTGPYLRDEIQHLGWEQRFSFVAGAGDFEKDKPAPDPIFHFLKKVNLAPSRKIWFVGDSSVDVEIAHNGGCTSVFLQGEKGVIFPQNREPHFVIQDCSELPVLLSDATC